MRSRRVLALALALGAAVPGLVAVDAAQGAVGALKDTPVGEVPVPEPGFLDPVPGGECEAENAYEDEQWEETVGGTVASLPEGAECERLRFAYGPIPVKPGQNDALLAPVTIEKPAYDGYVLRFKPDLVTADGTPPDVDRIHLHHSVWLKGDEALPLPQQAGDVFDVFDPDGGPQRYSDELIPFFAAGEEKTIADFPAGHGYPVDATDTWLLLYMVHNYTSQTDFVWITYDVDFVRQADGDAWNNGEGITPIHPVWIDVQRKAIAPGAPTTPANPVFNVQKGFGHDEGEGANRRRVCTWPKENCARFDAYGNVTPQQGQELPPGSMLGADEVVEKNAELRGEDAGTLVWMAGHLHPGGVRNDVELVRGGVAKPIFTSEGVGWDRDDPGEPHEIGKAGGPLDSWDFSMTSTALQHGWGVKIKAGDRLRINATYDSAISWYENMGIVVAFVALGDTSYGVDPFDAGVAIGDGVPSSAVARDTSLVPPGWNPPICDQAAFTLCTRGVPTHGHLPESSNFGGTNVQALPIASGDPVDTVPVADFTFGTADQAVVRANGAVPTVEVGERVRFVNADTAGDIWHTITRCAWPCTGASGLAYPKADGGDVDTENNDDFDSSEIGYGLFWSPAKAHVDEDVERFLRGWQSSPFNPPLSKFADDVDDGLLWEFEADTPGTYAFYCRIHIGMRGAIKVVG